MDALDPEDDEWRNRRPTPGPTSLMTISPDLTLHGREEAMEFLERKMEPEERCNPGSSGDVADDTLHDHDVNAGPSAANPTACVSWFDLSSPSSVPNEKKISSALPFLQIITTSRIGLESTVVNSTLSNPSCHDNSTHLASSLGLSLGGGFTFGSASTISKKTNSSILSRHAISSSIPPSRSYVQDISVGTSIHAQSLSSYDLIGTLGQGTSGKVFLASLKCDLGGGLHALKTIWKDDISSCSTQDTVDELSTLRLIAGALRLGDLSVPFLQILIEDFEDDNFLYLALEYHPSTLSAPETSARFRIDRKTRLALPFSISLPLTLIDHTSASTSPDQVVSSLRFLIAEISLGLLYLHENGIVHQDIKPANVMISNAGHAVIGDFGAASGLPPRSSKSLPDSSTFTSRPLCARSIDYGQIVLQPDDFITFTPLYAAPELRERNQTGLVVYDERADWWSLGVLMYELITGSAPFKLSYGTETLRSGRRSDGDQSLSFGPLESLAILNSSNDWYHPLENFLCSLLMHDPNERLSGPDIKRHRFFDPIFELWADIVALKCPPCPDPSTSPVDDSVSFYLYPPRGMSVFRNSSSLIVEGCFLAELTRESIESFMEPRGHSLELSTDELGDHPHGEEQTAEWETKQVIDYHDESDRESELQALPSTASMFFNLDQEVGDLHIRQAHDSGVELSMDNTTGIFPESILRDFHHNISFTPHQYPSSPRLNSPFGLRKQPSSTTKHPIRPEWEDWTGCSKDRPFKLTSCSIVSPDHEFVLPEKITLSLLEAMDNRDRRGTVYHQSLTMQLQKSKKDRLTLAPRKLLKVVARRYGILKKLHFW